MNRCHGRLALPRAADAHGRSARLCTTRSPDAGEFSVSHIVRSWRDESQFSQLLAIVLETHDRELDCDEFLALAARVGRAFRLDSATLKQLRIHLSICGDCSEEFEALLDAMLREGH